MAEAVRKLSVDAIKRSVDPTSTLTLRRAFSAQLVKRFRGLKSIVWESVAKNDSLAIGESARVRVLAAVPKTMPIPPYNPMTPLFPYTRSEDKIKEFMAWVKKQEEKGILQTTVLPGIGDTTDTPWTNIYIQSSYASGLEKSANSIRRSLGEEAIYPDTFRTQGVAGFLMKQPFHADRVGLLYSRMFSGLKGITDEMDKEMSHVLATGMVQGEGPYEMARKLNKRIDVGISRAQRLARTEVIYTHNSAKLNEFERMEAVTGHTVKVEWVTAGDESVRSTHKVRNGKMYTKKEALALLGEPNCRCTIVPFFDDLEEKEAPPKKKVEKPDVQFKDPKLSKLYQDTLEEADVFWEENKDQVPERAGYGEEFDFRFGYEFQKKMAEKFPRVYDVFSTWQNTTTFPKPQLLKHIIRTIEKTADGRRMPMVNVSDATKIAMDAMLEDKQSVKELTEEWVRFRAYNQSYMRKMGIKKMWLTRGTDGPIGKEMASKFKKETSNGTTELTSKILEPPLVGYTTNKDVAESGEFGFLGGGVTVYTYVPVHEIAVHSDLLSGITANYQEEIEFIILGGERRFNTSTELYWKGKDAPEIDFPEEANRRGRGDWK